MPVVERLARRWGLLPDNSQSMTGTSGDAAGLRSRGGRGAYGPGSDSHHSSGHGLPAGTAAAIAGGPAAGLVAGTAAGLRTGVQALRGPGGQEALRRAAEELPGTLNEVRDRDRALGKERVANVDCVCLGVVKVGRAGQGKVG